MIEREGEKKLLRNEWAAHGSKNNNKRCPSDIFPVECSSYMEYIYINRIIVTVVVVVQMICFLDRSCSSSLENCVFLLYIDIYFNFMFGILTINWTNCSVLSSWS